MTDFCIVIPARWQSSRLPGKPLLDIAGKPLLLRVCEQAQNANATQLVVATDDQRICDAVKSWGYEVVMTAVEHESGSDRVAEVANVMGWSDEQIIVNVQGDEPLIDPRAIQQVATNLANNPQAGIATLASPLSKPSELADPNAVKVVKDNQGMALYFSRAPIPWCRDSGSGNLQQARRHIGIYAYRAGALRQITKLPVADIEKSESLEQLRAMAAGIRIHVEDACADTGPGVDTQADLLSVAAMLEQGKIN
ncbi:MAG: 3-deoxy-manno-octulosonate cytidylyltransferase [Gammaproteobacteria bacterium]|nr:3-deoxy-manno-octulosonate cytidylyltransferase [Gammaproteobacteria bacterium]